MAASIRFPVAFYVVVQHDVVVVAVERNNGSTMENTAYTFKSFFQAQIIENITFNPFNLREQGIGFRSVVRKDLFHPTGVALRPAQRFYLMPGTG